MAISFLFCFFGGFSCRSVSSAVMHKLLKQPVLAIRLCGQRCAWVVAQCSLSQFGTGRLRRASLWWHPSVSTCVC